MIIKSKEKFYFETLMVEEGAPVIRLQQKLQDFLTSSGITDAEYKLPAIVENSGSAGSYRLSLP